MLLAQNRPQLPWVVTTCVWGQSLGVECIRVAWRALFTELKPFQIDVLGCVAGATLTPNYVSVAREGSRNSLVEQTSEEVVAECIAAIGKTATIATGAINKLGRIFFDRVLPYDIATWMMTHSMEQQVDHTRIPHQIISQR